MKIVHTLADGYFLDKLGILTDDGLPLLTQSIAWTSKEEGRKMIHDFFQFADFLVSKGIVLENLDEKKEKFLKP